MALDQDMNEYYGHRPLELGMGYRPCDRLEPSLLVRLHAQAASLLKKHPSVPALNA